MYTPDIEIRVMKMLGKATALILKHAERYEDANAVGKLYDTDELLHRYSMQWLDDMRQLRSELSKFGTNKNRT